MATARFVAGEARPIRLIDRIGDRDAVVVREIDRASSCLRNSARDALHFREFVDQPRLQVRLDNSGPHVLQARDRRRLRRDGFRFAATRATLSARLPSFAGM